MRQQTAMEWLMHLPFSSTHKLCAFKTVQGMSTFAWFCTSICKIWWFTQGSLLTQLDAIIWGEKFRIKLEWQRYLHLLLKHLSRHLLGALNSENRRQQLDCFSAMFVWIWEIITLGESDGVLVGAFTGYLMLQCAVN